MNSKYKVRLYTTLGICSYILLLIIYCIDLSQFWGTVNQISILDTRFIIVLCLILFWFLPICMAIYRNSKSANMTKVKKVSMLFIIFFCYIFLWGLLGL